METLKHSIRRMFEEKYSPYLYERNEFEDGLLEKIMNLSLLNASVFKYQPYSIVVAKSDKSKQKLCSLSNSKQEFVDTAVTLIVLGGTEEIEKSSTELLSISLKYAAKYYGVDCRIVRSIDYQCINREFGIDPGKKVIMVANLGYFNTGDEMQDNRQIQQHRPIVMEV